MEELLEKNMYLIDIENIDTIPEIIYELSLILDKEETKNKCICLKLGNVNLNQAQLLSIKSLINGVGSILSTINTKSIETEKNALSLGIIVSEVLNQNKKDEVLSDDMNNKTIENEVDLNEKEINTVVSVNNEEREESKEQIQDIENKTGQDELDVIFNSSEFNQFFNEGKNYVQHEPLDDIVVEETEYTKEDIEIEEFPTKYIKQTIRSGQVINYEGNIVIVGDCHVGCEITAFGDITVWGILNGIAHAGSNGNRKARVRALKMNAIQVRIADCYSRRPDASNIITVEKTNSFVPEEARIKNGEIVVFKINN